MLEGPTKDVAERFANWWCNRSKTDWLHVVDPQLHEQLNALPAAEQHLVYSYAFRVQSLVRQLPSEVA